MLQPEKKHKQKILDEALKQGKKVKVLEKENAGGKVIKISNKDVEPKA